jgi:hypothetical protein
MRFVEFLRTTVLLSAASATLLAVTPSPPQRGRRRPYRPVRGGLVLIATVIGAFLGRRASVTGAIGGLLADAKAATSMPEHRPAAVVINRLWPLFLATIVAGALGAVSAKIPAVATGFAIIWALSWRKQHRAVIAIEERDGAMFYVEDTSPIRPMELKRTPGMRREVPSINGGGAS